MKNFEVRSGWSTDSSGNVIEMYHIRSKSITNAIKQVIKRDFSRDEKKAVTKNYDHDNGILLLDMLVYNNEEYIINKYVDEFGKPELDEYDQFVDSELESKTYYWDIKEVTNNEERQNEEDN